MRSCRGILVVLATITVLLCLAGPATAGAVREINISYVKSPFNLQIMVMKSKGLLEQEFAADDIDVNWHEITSGAKQAQALAAKSLDIASVINTTSVLLANAGGNPVKIIGCVSRPSKTFAIVAGENGPKTIAELKGKTVAGPKGTVLHQMLLAALASEGMSESDVNHVSMDLPKARTAMLAGQVDAALLAASLVIKSVEAGAHVVTTAEGLVVPTLVMGAREEFISERPDLVARYLKVFREAMRFIEKNPVEAVAIGVAEHGISPEEGKTLADWAGFTDHLLPSDIENMRADFAFLKTQEKLKNEVEPVTVCLPVAFME